MISHSGTVYMHEEDTAQGESKSLKRIIFLSRNTVVIFCLRLKNTIYRRYEVHQDELINAEVVAGIHLEQYIFFRNVHPYITTCIIVDP